MTRYTIRGAAPQIGAQTVAGVMCELLKRHVAALPPVQSPFQLYGRGRIEIAATDPKTGASIQLEDGTFLAVGVDNFRFETWPTGKVAA